MSNDLKSKLRLLAIKSGCLDKKEIAQSLRWTEDDFKDKLEDKYPDCAAWKETDIDVAISMVGKSKKRQPAKSTKSESEKVESTTETETKQRAPARKRRSRKKAEDAPSESKKAEAPKKEETADKKRQPATRKKRQPAKSDEAAPAVFQVDGKALIEEFGLGDVKDQVVSNQKLLAALTMESEDNKVAVAELTAATEKLQKAVGSIAKFCTWFYNSETDDEIKNLTDVFK